MGAICFPPLLPIEKYASSLASALSGILVSSWLLETLRRNIEHPQLGRAIPYPRGPFTCEPLGIEPRGRAPNLGEHTRKVLAQDLGLAEQDIAALASAGAIK